MLGESALVCCVEEEDQEYDSKSIEMKKIVVFEQGDIRTIKDLIKEESHVLLTDLTNTEMDVDEERWKKEIDEEQFFSSERS